MAMLASEPEMNHLDMDEFINFSVTNESPARPIIMRMNQAAAAAAAAAANSMNTKDHAHSPFDGDFNINDLGNHSSNEWLGNMGLESVLGPSTPSSRGSSLETPSLPQNGFVSIDPTRLKEVPSAPPSEMSKSPSWSVPELQPSSYESPNGFPPPSTQPSQQQQHMEFAQSNSLQFQPTPVHDMNRRFSESSDNAPALGKRKRQGSLPDIFIPTAPAPQPRGLQRSMSTGTPIIVTQLDTSAATLGHNFLGLPQSSEGSLSAPPMSQHPMSFAPSYQAPPSNGTPLLTPQSAAAPNGHQRAFSYSGLATIPEAPSSAPPDVQWTPIPDGHAQFRYGNTDITAYQMPSPNMPSPAPLATPALPFAPSPMLPEQIMEMNGSRSGLPVGATLRRPSSCPGTSPSTGIPAARQGYTLQLQQQEAQRLYLQPHVQQFQPQQQQNSPLLSAGPLSAHAHFSPLPNYSPQLPDGQFPMSAGQLSGVPMSGGPLSATAVGIGRPILHPQSSHTRRSSDTELAFAMGQHNVGAMLRSTSVPQTIMEPTPLYATSSLPPPPAVNGYRSMTFVPYEPQGGLGYGRPRDMSPPRKRVASKRVGTCLKPGPKGKPKPKAEGEMTLSLMNQPLGSLEDEPLHSIHDDIPTNLVPVSFEEFQASFTVTPSGTIIPMLGIEVMTERLMYATPEPVVDACFRWCYQIGSEFNQAAEKQSKYFRCCFDECVGSNSRIFMRKSAVDSHVRTHIGFRPFRCEADPECDARFVRKHDRDRHVATTHRNEKSFLCTDCGQNFARSDALLRHRAKRDACKARTGQL